MRSMVKTRPKLSFEISPNTYVYTVNTNIADMIWYNQDDTNIIDMMKWDD